MDNPAKLSTTLAKLFPSGVIAAELWQPGAPALLHAEEVLDLGRATSRRIAEFAAGRLCARRALAEFGFGDFALRVNVDRSPLWPKTVVGSITHTDGFCGAVVARQGQIRAIGVDAEIIGRVTQDLWSRICTPAEIAWIERFPPHHVMTAATLVFAAKEAFYKCQYPLTGAWLDFHDAELLPDRCDLDAGCFAIHAPAKAGQFDLPMPLAGRFAIADGLLLVGIAHALG